MSNKGYTTMEKQQLPSYQEALIAKPVAEQEKPIKRRFHCLRLVTYLLVLIGIGLLACSLFFKFKAVNAINSAVDGGCPYPCIDQCYNEFGQKVSACIQEGCEQCDTLGMQQASRYTLLFIVFLGLGALLVLIQLFSMCFTYSCTDYHRNN
jgi:hypothetical protein